MATEPRRGAAQPSGTEPHREAAPDIDLRVRQSEVTSPPPSLPPHGLSATGSGGDAAGRRVEGLNGALQSGSSRASRAMND